MTIYHQDQTVTVWHGDCIDVMRGLPDASVDAIVTDPPYGLEFMGKKWDAYTSSHAFQDWCQAWATEALRVLKPGGHMLAFGGTRTFHRLTCGIENAGFQIRDCISWLYGSGFPKSLDVSKAIDKAAGAKRSLTRPGVVQRGGLGEDWDMGRSDTRPRYDTPATDTARQWQGWGTALKPAYEPIIVARKPLTGTVAQNVLQYGTGALNVDATRIGTEENTRRWPANIVLDEDTARVLDQHSGASRFFYKAKANSNERVTVDGVSHPTVKPLDLTRWLAKLVTPPGGLILDPFAGSGTTGEAAILEGFRVTLIEQDTTYLPLIQARITRGQAGTTERPAS